MEKRCKYCNKIIIKDFDKWLDENPETAYLLCPFCYGMERIR